MKNLRYCHDNPIEGIQYHIYKSFSGHAERVLYLLNMHAQDLLEKKIGKRPDICLLTNCYVVPGQRTVLITEETKSKLLGLDVDTLLVQELFGTERRKPNLAKYLTHSGPMDNGLYCGLFISEGDIQKALFETNAL